MKKRIQKLRLNRETLCTLGEQRLQQAEGGATLVCTRAACTEISWCYHCITADATDCPSCATC
jgi:hypothetical protein